MLNGDAEMVGQNGDEKAISVTELKVQGRKICRRTEIPVFSARGRFKWQKEGLSLAIKKNLLGFEGKPGCLHNCVIITTFYY